MNQPMIAFHNVSKRFSRKGNSFLALENINIEIDYGDIFGVIGYSGAGKSTLLRLINNLESASQGEVRIKGTALQQLTGAELNAVKKNIGMIFQNFNLLNAKTVYHNVAIPLILQGKDKGFIKARVNELLAFVNLGDKINSYPGELSGGQKQRVGIARAMATNPSILLCDEATSALDPHTTIQILQLLKEINKRYGVTIVLITHEMSVIQKICNRMAVIDKGRVVEQGNVLQLFSQPKEPITASFVQTVIHERLPENVVAMMKTDTSSLLLRLEFVGSTAQQPLINELIKRFDVQVNILFANMSEVQATILGFMIVKLRGEHPQREAALAYLHEAGVKIIHV